MKTKHLVFCGIATALLCVLCPIAIPVAIVPLTLATLIIYLIASISDWYISLISVCLYILIGCMGLPVFSGFTGGIAQLAGPTGGFIVGYIPLTLTVSLLRKNRLYQIIGLTVGTVFLYISGIIGFIISTESGFYEIFTVCILPFLPGDIVKVILTILITPKLNPVIKKI